MPEAPRDVASADLSKDRRKSAVHGGPGALSARAWASRPTGLARSSATLPNRCGDGRAQARDSDDEQRQLLRVAASSGIRVRFGHRRPRAGRDPADVEDALQSLDRVHGLVQLLREQELPSRLFSLRYQFVHVLYQSALYASVSPTRKAVWSAKVGAALEKEHGDRNAPSPLSSRCCTEMARDPWRASEHFLAAAQVASSRFATREALAFARKGLACLSAGAISLTRRRESWRSRQRCSIRLPCSKDTGRRPPSRSRSA